MAIRVGGKKRKGKQDKQERKNKRKTRKEERQEGKPHDHLKKLENQSVTSQFSLDEVFYHFGNVSIDYTGTGRKNCELHIIAEGARMHTHDFVAKDGRDFTLNRQWLMANNARVVVTTKNRRETLFNVAVPKANNTAASARQVSRSAGEYRLEFCVYKDTSYKNRIQYQYEQFKSSKRPGVWNNVDKSRLLKDLKLTTGDPREVNQEAAGFCGATAIGYALAVSQPHRLIEFCQELYENGSMRGAEKTFRASSKFRNSPVPRDNDASLSMTDYLFTGTLMEDAGFKRQEYQETLSINEDGAPEIEQDYNKEGSMTGAQKRWSRELLGYRNDRGIGDKFPLGKQIKALVECRRVLNAKGFVFPNIHADIVRPKARKAAVKFPNHWITMTDIAVYNRRGTKLAVTDANVKNIDEVHATVFTWGHFHSGRLDKSHYKKFVWLYIVCEPFTNQNLVEQLKKVS